MIRTCLHCKAPFETDDYGVMPNSSCECGGCYASKEDLKDAIAWHKGQTRDIYKTLRQLETLECQDD